MQSLTRRNFIAAAAVSASANVAAQSARRPNILFIMVDEMRWDAMGCEKHPVVKTPNLDRLAAQSVRFANSYTVSPVCCPARNSVFTGRYAHVHGCTSNGIPAHNGEIFLPSILKHYGYHTAIAGKLHYTPVRFDYGFDQFWSFASEGPTPKLGYNEFMRQKHGSPAKWPIVDGTCPWPDDPLGRDVGQFKFAEEDFETDWITARSLEYLQSRKDNQQPWFLFTSYLKPHSPSVEPEPYFNMYDPKAMPIPKLPPNAKEIRASKQGQQRRQFVDDPEMMRVMTAKYFGAITHVDTHVGKMLAELESLGMAGNTLVLFTADHGNMLGDKGRWFKGVQYEGSAHVPLLWRAAQNRKASVVDQVVENTDLVPSILETAGIPVPAGVQGKSFLKLAAGADPKWKNRCFSQLRSGMLLEGKWKLIDNSLDGSGTLELFDLGADPKEDRNLAEDAKQQARVAAMRKKLAAWRAERPAPVTIAGMATPAYAQVSEEERKQAIEAAPSDDAPRQGGRRKK